MRDPITPGAGRDPVEPCEACGVVLVIGVIAGCYVAGFGYSGWLALGVGLHVWLLGALAVKRWGGTGKDTGNSTGTGA